MIQELFQGAVAGPTRASASSFQPEGVSLTSEHLLLRSSLSALPECSRECLAGQKDLGYLYAAVHDPLLAEVFRCSYRSDQIFACVVWARALDAYVYRYTFLLT